MDDVSMIGVGVSSAGSWGLFWSVTVATELVMLGVSVKEKSLIDYRLKLLYALVDLFL